jgi:hypothetical protein
VFAAPAFRFAAEPIGRASDRRRDAKGRQAGHGKRRSPYAARELALGMRIM